MPDIRQYAQESLAEELTLLEPIFASVPMPEPLGDEVLAPPASPPMADMPLLPEMADLATPESATATAFDLPLGNSLSSTEFDLPIGNKLQATAFDLPPLSKNLQTTAKDLPLPGKPTQAKSALELPSPPVAQAFDLPMGATEASQIELLKPPSRPAFRDFNLPMDQPKKAEGVSLEVLMREQREYSEMSLRDFMAEHQAEPDLPLPGRTETPFEPFPLPERNRTPDARLDTPFVPPAASPNLEYPDLGSEAAGFFSEPFPSEQKPQGMMPDFRAMLERDRQLYSMGQE